MAVLTTELIIKIKLGPAILSDPGSLLTITIHQIYQTVALDLALQSHELIKHFSL